MQTSLTTQVLKTLKELIHDDSRQPVPVIQSVSLSFWEQVKRWTQQLEQSDKPFIIALSGGSGSGKSMIRETLVQSLEQWAPVSAFTQDNYYRNFSEDFPQWSVNEFYHRIDFDDPEHFRLTELAQDLQRIKTLPQGHVVALPRLIYGTPQAKPTRVEAGLPLTIQPFIITEGIHAFHHPDVCAQYDLKIFVDVDEATRRARWLQRNQLENRGITDNMWQTTVSSLHQYILPARAKADVVMSNLAEAQRIQQFMQHVVSLLQQASRSVA